MSLVKNCRKCIALVAKHEGYCVKCYRGKLRDIICNEAIEHFRAYDVDEEDATSIRCKSGEHWHRMMAHVAILEEVSK